MPETMERTWKKYLIWTAVPWVGACVLVLSRPATLPAQHHRSDHVYGERLMFNRGMYHPR